MDAFFSTHYFLRSTALAPKGPGGWAEAVRWVQFRHERPMIVDLTLQVRRAVTGKEKTPRYGETPSQPGVMMETFVVLETSVRESRRRFRTKEALAEAKQ